MPTAFGYGIIRANAQAQLQGYARGLQHEYPEARIALFIIDCFGNRGYRIFPAATPEASKERRLCPVRPEKSPNLPESAV